MLRKLKKVFLTIHREIESRQVVIDEITRKKRTCEGYQLLSPGRSDASTRDKNSCGG